MFGQGHQVGGVGVGAGEPLAEAGGVRQQLVQGGAVARLNVRHVGADVLVQIRLAGVHQLQRRDAGEHLRDRADAKERALGVHGHIGVEPRPAVTAQHHHPAVMDHGHGRAGDVLLLQQLRHGGVDQGG